MAEDAAAADTSELSPTPGLAAPEAANAAADDDEDEEEDEDDAVPPPDGLPVDISNYIQMKEID